jgi:hypothetical protein
LRPCALALLLLITTCSLAQDIVVLPNKIISSTTVSFNTSKQLGDSLAAPADSTALFLAELPAHLFEKITRHKQKASESIQQQNQKILKQLQAKESKILAAISKAGIITTTELYDGVNAKYEALCKQIVEPPGIVNSTKQSGQYIPRIDSLKTMLKFLTPLVKNTQQAEQALASVEGLQAKLTQAEDIKSFITEREAALKNLLQSYTKLPTGITQSIGKYSKEFYYYKERIKGWKEELNNPEKIEKTALAILNKVPAFQKFWQQNSELGALFGQPGGNYTPTTITGLQTRITVQQVLQQQFGQAGNPMQLIQQQTIAAQQAVSQVQNNLTLLKSGEKGNGETQGDFLPNSQKTKSFSKRLELGWNLQTGSMHLVNAGSWGVNDLGLSAGYKLSDRFIAGVSMAYKFGLGSGWKHLAFTHEGIGFRCWFDYKITSLQKGYRVLFGNLWFTAGYERNYFAAFKQFPELKTAAWQTSGLIGVSKKMQYKTKTAKISLLWDFLKTKGQMDPALVWRVGWSL